MSTIWFARATIALLNNIHRDTAQFMSVGSAITANHLRAATQGVVTGTTRPLHLGRSSHLWEIDVVDEEGRAVCLARLTTMVVPVGRLPQTSQIPKP